VTVTPIPSPKTLTSVVIVVTTKASNETDNEVTVLPHGDACSAMKSATMWVDPLLVYLLPRPVREKPLTLDRIATLTGKRIQDLVLEYVNLDGEIKYIYRRIPPEKGVRVRPFLMGEGGSPMSMEIGTSPGRIRLKDREKMQILDRQRKRSTAARVVQDQGCRQSHHEVQLLLVRPAKVIPNL